MSHRCFHAVLILLMIREKRTSIFVIAAATIAVIIASCFKATARYTIRSYSRMFVDLQEISLAHCIASSTLTSVADFIAVVEALKEMGFSDDDGMLSRLVVTLDGHMERVLDAIQMSRAAADSCRED